MAAKRVTMYDPADHIARTATYVTPDHGFFPEWRHPLPEGSRMRGSDRVLRRVCLCAFVLWLPVLNLGSPAAQADSSKGGTCASHPDDLLISGDLVPGRGEFLSPDQQIMRLAWLDTPVDYLAARHTALQALLAREFAMQASVHVRSGGVQDRWGGLGVLADLRGVSGSCINIQAWLLGQGLARLRPERDNEPAPAELALWREAEQLAGKARLGLWGADDHMRLNALDADAIKKHEGRFVIVEGIVQSVNERPNVTYLNFGSRWSEDMTVSSPARIWRILKRRGLTAASLQGSKIRVRGIVETRGGPLIELTSPADLELAGTENLP